MPGNIYKRGSVWWGRVQHQGQEYRRSLQTTSRSDAQKRVDRWIKDLHAAQWGEKPAPTFEDAVVHFFEVSRDLKPSTVARYQSSLRLLDPFVGGLRIPEITRDILQSFTSHRRRAGAAMPTIRRDISFLSSVLTEAGLHWEFENNVAMTFMKHARRRGTLRDSEARTRYLSHAEEDQLLNACSPALAPAVMFAIDTGLRREEQFGLEWRDVDMARGEIVVRGERAKKHTSRRVPLLDRSARILAQMPRRLRTAGGPDAVFCKSDGTRYRDRRSAFDTALRKSELQDVIWHDLRRTRGCRLMQDEGANLEDVRDWLGHASVVTTERHYAFLSIDRLKSLAQNPAQRQRFTNGKSRK